MIFRKLFKKWLLVCLFLLIFMISFPIFLVITETGTHLFVQLAQIFSLGQLKISKIQGRLWDNLQIQGLSWKHKNRTIHLKNAALSWQWHWFSVKGRFTSQSLIIQQKQEQLFFQDFANTFSGNSLKTLQTQSTWKGYFNQIPWTGNLDWKAETLDVNIQTKSGNLSIKGKPAEQVIIKGDIAEPAKWHAALKDFHAPIHIEGTIQEQGRGVMKITMDAGHLDIAKMRLPFQKIALTATGNWHKLQLKGQVQMPEYQLNMQAIIHNLQTWKGHAVLSKGNHMIAFDGSGILKPEITGDVHITAQDFPLLENSEYTILATPDLHARFTPKQLAMEGTIRIPQARIQPLSFEEGVRVSEDMRIADSTKTAEIPLPLNMTMHITLIPGDAVFLRYKGLNTRLTGQVVLNKSTQKPLTAQGQLSMIQGKYKAYGQNLTIDEGFLVFTGGLLTQPAIQLKAIRKFTTRAINDNHVTLKDLQTQRLGNTSTIVGIALSGWLEHPKVRLYSNPAGLSDADILSMLILGHPVNEAGKAKAQVLLAALASLDKGKSSAFLEKMQQKLNIDVQLKTTSKFDRQTHTVTDRTGVVIGKALSKKLYISYNAGLSQTDADTFTVNWLLNNFLSLQITATSTGKNGIDLLYFANKDSTHAIKTSDEPHEKT